MSWAFVGAKFKCVLDFKKHEMVSAERKAREHTVAMHHRLSDGIDCDGWLSNPYSASPFPGVTLLEVMSLCKSATSTLTSRMKNSDLIHPGQFCNDVEPKQIM